MLWPPPMLQSIPLLAIGSPAHCWWRGWEGVQSHKTFLLRNICFLSGGVGERLPPLPTHSYYIFLRCHTAWQFILGSARWHLRHRADKALRVTSMRPVGAVTMPPAMKSDKMDNGVLNIFTKQEKKRLQLLVQFSASEGNKATGRRSTSTDGKQFSCRV